MNKERRKNIDNIIEQLESLKSDVDLVFDEEQEAYDNLPEGIQVSDRGETMQAAIDNLQTAMDGIDDVIASLTEAKGE